MGAFFSYTLYVSIVLAICFLVYAACLRDVRNATLQRCLLSGIIVLSLCSPFIGEAFTGYNPGASGGTVLAEAVTQTVLGDTAPSRAGNIILTIYCAGAAVCLANLCIQIWRLCRLIRSGRRTGRDGYTLVLVDDDIQPVSWMHYIIMNARDADTGMILAHEYAHVRCRHSADVLVCRVLCCLLWYNPAAWLLTRELMLVHEYQADEAVVRRGFDERQYQLMLIKKAAGSRFQSLANSLIHSLIYKRIFMMCKKKNKGAALARTLALIPAVAAALSVVNIHAVASVLGDASALEFTGKVTTKSASVQETVAEQSAPLAEEPVLGEVEQHAQFPGGEMAMFRFLMDNIKYPAEAEAAKEEGRVVVSFIVEKDGRLTDLQVVRSVSPTLDAEALRVIGAMPRWEPARLDGSPVRVTYTLPVSFRLQ